MNTARQQYKTIDEYIDTFPDEARRVMQTIRQVIQEEAPDATESISYQIPTYKLNGKRLIYFAAFKKHISLYPTTPELEAAIEELSAYKKGKGTVQFPLDKPMPLPLIREIVRVRRKEVLEG